ncbi:uncharacterized protein HGUI_01852 [Hanseniaspora guilliermondii]|uniref:Uncharacterized protein n=1 Tax=Hanseniaspora guilliermondii TaxID=56406 RepID=A0A1L0B1I6_9ASCO|nr:uncharacterized protein HGUI_01852 [Hanseniaspora guilliermondii]
MIFNNSYNSHLTQFSKDSLNWSKITKDSLRKVSGPWETLDKNITRKKSLDEMTFKGKSIELIKPDTCDVFGPQNSQRIIRRKLISKDTENIDPTTAGQKNKKFDNTQDYKQSQELLNYVAYENIPADRSYQTLIFDSERKDKPICNFEEDLDLITKYLNAIKLMSSYLFKKVNSFKNSPDYFFPGQRLDVFSLKMQLTLNFTKYACFYFLPSHEANLKIGKMSFLVLLMFTTLQFICNYFSLTYFKNDILTHSNRKILNKINNSSLSLSIKKYIIGQNIFTNAVLQAHFLRLLVANLQNVSTTDKSYVYYAFQALVAINYIINLDELIFDLLPIFLTIKDIKEQRYNYSLNGNEESAFETRSGIREEAVSMSSEMT